jgi:hypothetical protein
LYSSPVRHWFRHRAGRRLSDYFPDGAVSVPVTDRDEDCEAKVAADVMLGRAQAGDERAFGELTEPYLSELQLHCYRILGSVQDAEDVLQETMLAAWRGLSQYEGRASLRTWLYRIATNRCQN